MTRCAGNIPAAGGTNRQDNGGPPVSAGRQRHRCPRRQPHYNAPSMFDSVFISLSLTEGAYHIIVDRWSMTKARRTAVVRLALLCQAASIRIFSPRKPCTATACKFPTKNTRNFFEVLLTQFEPPSEFNTSITRPAFGTHPAAVLASVLPLSADR